MSLNLVKLCVGVSAVEELQASIDFRLDSRKANGRAEEQIHTTRMVPRRMDEILGGGSLYWVIKGNVQCRQVISDLRPYTDEQGIGRCDIVMEPRIILTDWQPRRAFQGWRYLTAEDAPADMGAGTTNLMVLPPDLRLELARLGLL